MDSKIKYALNVRYRFYENLLYDSSFLQSIEHVSQILLNALKQNHKILLCGNGGSASDSQHIASEFVVKLSKHRKALAAIALTSDNSIITAIANDFSYQKIFERQVEALGCKGDVLIGLSTSGNSSNIIEAFQYAKKHDIYTIGITGNEKAKIILDCDCYILIPNTTQIVQELYLMIFHTICESIEDYYGYTKNNDF